MAESREVLIRNRALKRELRTGRLIASCSGGSSGPVIILLCGIHGNETAGVFATYDLINSLKREKTDLKGKIVAVAGNLPALSMNRRYIDADLNRIWSDDRLYKLQRGIRLQKDNICELEEQKEIYEIIRAECLSASGQVYIIDLHTTSAESTAFIFISDTLRNRQFVKSIPLPVILGVEELLNSTLLNFANRLGIICFGLEAGCHESIHSYENTVNTLWITLEKAGCFGPGAGENQAMRCSHTLKSSNGSIHGYFELVYRYAISEREEFRMHPGYINFQDVVKGQYLADSNNEKIMCQETGRILMPLYQKMGNDGFYIIKKVNTLWIELSAVLRKTGFDRLFRYIPGIFQINNNPHRYAVRSAIANRLVMRLFHLFGYQRSGQINNFTLFSKRRYDMMPPDNYSDFFAGHV